MRRSATVFVVLLALLWQAVALARPGSTINVLADLEHAALHWQQVAHHHHDDGSFHVDDSPASTFHVLGDPLTVTAALLPDAAPQVVPGASGPPGARHGSRVPDPFLDGLLRPPRAHA